MACLFLQDDRRDCLLSYQLDIFEQMFIEESSSLHIY